MLSAQENNPRRLARPIREIRVILFSQLTHGPVRA
jgi:hypothetical protein